VGKINYLLNSGGGMDDSLKLWAASITAAGYLKEPEKIQEFLDSIPYNSRKDTKSPLRVLKERSAHCFEGALFAAAVLRTADHRSLIVDLRAENDDDHVIAVFNQNGRWGAIAKSNFTTLRFREPVYRSIRELAMSYFDLYFNTSGEKTLREYSVPFDLSRLDHRNWMTAEGDLEYIGDMLDRSRHYRLVGLKEVRNLTRVPRYLMEAGLMGSDPDGLFIPR
jgi:hypothetical protein